MIKKVIIENFRSIDFMEWENTTAFNALLGKNGKGKSSFLSALRFALTGDAERIDVADGKDCATVSVELDDGSKFSRTIYAADKPSKVTVNGKNATAKVLAEKLETHFKCSPADMKFVSSKTIGEVKPAEFGQFIGRFLPDKLTAKTVLSYASMLTEEQQDLLATFLPAGEFELGELDEIYKVLFNVRKTKKQDLVVLKSKSTFDGPLPKETLETLDAEIAKLSVQEAMIAENKKRERVYLDAVAKKKVHDDQVADLEKQVKAITVAKPNEKVLEIAEKNKGEAIKSKAEMLGTIATLKNNIKTFDDILTNLASSKCPLSDLVVCTTDKSAAKENIENSKKESEEQIKLLTARVDECDAKIAESDKRIAAYKVQLNGYQRLKELTIRLDALKKADIVIPEKPEEIKSAEDIAAQKAALQEKKTVVALYNESVKAASLITAGEKEVEDFNVLVDALSPKGEVRRGVTEYYLGFFEDTINDLAQKMNPEFEFHFSAADGFSFFFRTNTKANCREYAALSDGEKVICNLLLLMFVSKFSGTGILFVDNLNDLDADNLAAVLDITNSLKSEYNSVFFAAVDTVEVKDALSKYSVNYIF